MYTVIGAFDDRQAAQRAVDKLIVQGFPRDAVDLQSRPATLDRAATTGTSADEYAGSRRDDDEGFFAGVRHFFASLFGTDDEAQAGMYSEAIRRGGSVVVVDARDEQQADRAAELLREQGGMIDLDERSASWRAEGWREDAWRDDDEERRGITGGTAGAMAAQQLIGEDRVVHTAGASGTEPNLASRTSRDPAPGRDTGIGAGRAETDREVVMPVVQEEARIGKRAIEQGGVRVVRRVTEQPVSELVRLREERARIDRRPADRAATSADLESFREGTVEVRERTEEPVVQKVARVVEEVVVGREVNERTERVEDKVRRTDVEIDRLAREADESLQRATGDDALRDDDGIEGLPGEPPPRERSLGEKLKDSIKGDRQPRH